MEKVNRYCLSLSEKVSANKVLVAVFPGEAKMVRLESFLKLTMAQYGYWCGQQTEKLANEYDDELVFERSS